jgi:hypothetical protein
MLRLLNKLAKEYLKTEAPLLDSAGPKGESMAAIKRNCTELFAELDPAQHKLVLAIFFIANNHLEAASKLLPKREDLDTSYVHGFIQRRLGD